MTDNSDPINELILQGALEVAGFDSETEELTYTFTDKLQDVSPELHAEFTNYFHQEMMFLWEKGFVNISMTDEVPKVTLTDKAFNDAEINALDQNKKYSLKEIIRILLQ